MRDLTAEEQAYEVRMIKASSAWPLFPILPVKKLGAVFSRVEEPDRTSGIVLSSELDTPKVYFLNLFRLDKDKTIRENCDAAESIEFESVEAMVAEGWVGD